MKFSIFSCEKNLWILHGQVFCDVMTVFCDCILSKMARKVTHTVLNTPENQRPSTHKCTGTFGGHVVLTLLKSTRFQYT